LARESEGREEEGEEGMKEVQLFEPSDFFDKRGRFFGRFRHEAFDRSVLWIMERPPIRVWGEWYWTRGMK
jgi:dTDP-4-dehydrorhamnose 3,5-epimerase-like enzyme